jgi:hypothetical protein
MREVTMKRRTMKKRMNRYARGLVIAARQRLGHHLWYENGVWRSIRYSLDSGRTYKLVTVFDEQGYIPIKGGRTGRS